MSNNLKHPIVIIASIFLFLFVLLKFAPSIPVSVLNQAKGEPFVVSGEGKVSVTPDIADVSLGIMESNSSLKVAQTNVNNKSKQLTDELTKMGIEKEDIKSTSYNVYPQYDYNTKPNRITGYQVSTDYQVKVRDFDKINDVLAKSTELGVNTIGGVSFEINDDTKKQKLQDARAIAISEAKEKAKGLASAAGISLGKIINVTENTPDTTPRMFNAAPMAADSLGKGAGTPQANIEPGQTDITVTISLTYEVR